MSKNLFEFMPNLKKVRGMRPLVWGFILTVVGAFFWVLFSVVFGVAAGLSGTDVPSTYMALIYVSGVAMLFSLPVAVVIELYRWIKKKKKRTGTFPE